MQIDDHFAAPGGNTFSKMITQSYNLLDALTVLLTTTYTSQFLVLFTK